MENKIMYNAVCSTCGKACEVPFKPNLNKPVNCLDCYKASRPQAAIPVTTETQSAPMFSRDKSIIAQCCLKAAVEIVKNGEFDDKEAFDDAFIETTILCVAAYKTALKELE